MKSKLVAALSTAFLAMAFFGTFATAADAIVDQKFDALDLAKLPPGWTLAEPSMLSMVPDDKRGHPVLKFTSVNDGKMLRFPHLSFEMPAAAVVGKTLKVTTWAKFPGAYILIEEQSWAKPLVKVEVLDAGGKRLDFDRSIKHIQAGQPEWKEVTFNAPVPANAAKVYIRFMVPIVACELYFDGLNVTTVDAPPVAAVGLPAANPAVANPAVANPAAMGVPVVPKPAAPVAAPATAAARLSAPADPGSPLGIAQKAPVKTIDEGGMTFGPDFAAILQKSYPSKTATVNTGTVLFVGAGFTDKTAPKLAGSWRTLPVSAKLSGAAALSPRVLMVSLVDSLLKDKPEVVFISDDAAPGRKPTTSEAEDWEDLGKLCLRYGALPVLVPHSMDSKDESYDSIVKSFKKAADINNYVMVSLVPAEAFQKRTENMLKLLDTHVFLRTKMAAEGGKPGTPGAGKMADE